ncbi:RecQ mediated genome instability protein [Trypanosoma melophagium]|uniref:RecQ mediated genome instability protein n=1 Tax=Trypanosoma melophagium TaxID=715481 RepID=UPI00351A71F6|nr:RecQ mediated genome instability protein [Trypanosoma melophagium]
MITNAAVAPAVVSAEPPTEEFLYSNMEYLATLDPPTIHPVLPSLPEGVGLLPADFQLTPLLIEGEQEGTTSTEENSEISIILQVNIVEDVSLPFAQRLRSMAPQETTPENNEQQQQQQQMSVEETLRALESDETSFTRRGRRQRLLRLTLTDGFSRIIAMEDSQHSCQALRGGVALGAKLRIFAPLKIRHGVLILTSERTVLLGGFVPELQAFWTQHAMAILEEMSGRSKRRTIVPQSQSRTNAVVAANRMLAPPLITNTTNTNTNISRTTPFVTDVVGNSNNSSNTVQQRQQPPALLQSTTAGISGGNISERSLIQNMEPQPLSAWRQHHPPTAPFLTRAVISDVRSELTIRENVGNPILGGTSQLFSLLVMLITPPRLTNDNSDNKEWYEGLGRSRKGEEMELLVDLGHRWLRQALRMEPDAFRKLSLSREPNDMANLDALVNDIGRDLENLGEAIFLLRQREMDGVVEVMEVQRLSQS